MKRSNTLKLSSILPDYIREMNIGRKMKEVDVIHEWNSILGPTFAKYTGKIYVSGSTLYVQITSPVVRSELIMMRESLRLKLNEKAGEEMIRSIVFK